MITYDYVVSDRRHAIVSNDAHTFGDEDVQEEAVLADSRIGQIRRQQSLVVLLVQFEMARDLLARRRVLRGISHAAPRGQRIRHRPREA